MRTRSLLALAVLGITLLSGAARAQDIPAAERGDLEVGGTLSLARVGVNGTINGSNGMNYPGSSIFGGSLYANFNVIGNVGLTAQFDYPDYHTPGDFLEKSYMVGLRYYHPVQRYTPYVKGMVGLASTSYDNPIYLTYPGTPGSYTALAFGGGLDVRFNHRITVRAIDFQLEDWLGFPGGSIHPTIVSIGAAYRIR